jgi:hypothetical protein
MACGQHPPPAAQAGELEQDDPQGVSAALDIAMRPITEGIFSVCVELHEGQGMVLSRSPNTSSSYTLPHDEQRYSKIGMNRLLN